MPSVSRYRTRLAVPADGNRRSQSTSPDERAHARHLGQGAQTLVRPPGGRPVELDRWLPRPQDVSMNGSDPVTEFARGSGECRTGSERTAGHGRENPPCPDRR